MKRKGGGENLRGKRTMTNQKEAALGASFHSTDKKKRFKQRKWKRKKDTECGRPRRGEEQGFRLSMGSMLTALRMVTREHG